MKENGQVGQGMLVFGILIAFLCIIIVLSIYPYLEGTITGVGTSMSAATGYSAQTGPADTAKSTLWGFIAILLILGFFVEILTWRRH